MDGCHTANVPRQLCRGTSPANGKISYKPPGPRPTKIGVDVLTNAGAMSYRFRVSAVARWHHVPSREPADAMDQPPAQPVPPPRRPVPVC